MIPVIGRRRRAVPPPEPPLPVPRRPAYAGQWGELPATKHLPDPYGPDPVVFGSVPRVKG